MKVHPIKGAEGIKRGEVLEFQTSQYNHHFSRSTNAVEHATQLKKIQSDAQSALDDVNRKFSVKYLEFYRGLLKPYNTKRHVIKIAAGMGACCISIDNELLQSFSASRGVFVVLREIEQSLNYDDVWLLDNERLN